MHFFSEEDHQIPRDASSLGHRRERRESTECPERGGSECHSDLRVQEPLEDGGEQRDREESCSLQTD